LPVRRGKVRDVYDLGQQLLLVSTDRLSAFDWVLPTGIPDKGRVLTQIAAFWFERLAGANHLITTDVRQMPLPEGVDCQMLEGRTTLCRKTQVVPFECVVRSYLSGSGWAEYRKSGTVCGIRLPAGLSESARLPEPIFTPATKAETGHDENITFEQMADALGRELSEELRRRSIDIFQRGAAYALERGIIIADTKFEFGFIGEQLVLADEVLTPDSSRFWPRASYQPGGPQASYDKQYVRDYLESIHWNKQPPAPALPFDVVERTSEKYREAYRVLTGKPL
jgi:phosphoribosylaminoimidazole-succinocarboxamide synthase